MEPSPMTKSELQQLIDRIPETVLGDGSRQLVVSADDLGELTAVLIELANVTGELTREWMARGRAAF
jgi:hypothetical protein